MKNFKNKKELTNWAYEQFDKYNIPKPETYSADELKYLNPGIPEQFIDEHVAKRGKV